MYDVSGALSDGPGFGAGDAVLSPSSSVVAPAPRRRVSPPDEAIQALLCGDYLVKSTYGAVFGVFVRFTVDVVARDLILGCALQCGRAEQS